MFHADGCEEVIGGANCRLALAPLAVDNRRQTEDVKGNRFHEDRPAERSENGRAPRLMHTRISSTEIYLHLAQTASPNVSPLRLCRKLILGAVETDPQTLAWRWQSRPFMLTAFVRVAGCDNRTHGPERDFRGRDHSV